MNEPIFCPFCGGEVVQETGEHVFYDEPIEEYECVFCKECGATIKGKTVEEVINYTTSTSSISTNSQPISETRIM